MEDPDLDRSLDSDEELEVSEDIEYIRSIGKDSQLPESNTRDEPFKFRRLQAVFDKGGLEAAHTILNETSSILNILTLYWTSFRPLLINITLLGLPFHDERYSYRCSILEQAIHDVDPSTTALLPSPRLRFLVVSSSCDWKRDPLNCDTSIISPNLIHLGNRFPRRMHTGRWLELR